MDPPQETPSPECWDRGLGSQNPTGYEVGRERILSHKSEFPATGICKLTSPPSYEVFGCRPFIDLCCPRRQGRRSKTSKEGNRESEGRRRRCDLWGFESRWRLLSSGRNDYQRRFRRIERSEGVFSGGNGIIFFAAAVFARGARSIIGRAPSARRQKRAELRRGG